MDLKNIIALDTETTGPNLWHGDKPFAVSTCDLNGRTKLKTRLWEWSVDPFTREPQVPSQDKRDIIKYVKGKTICFHNARFDIRAMNTIGIDLFKYVKGFHDTIICSHILDSGESHKLKDLGVKYLDILDDDEKELKKLVIKAHRRAKKLGWNISETVPCDYWVPKALDPESTECERYAVNDAIRTFKLLALYLPEIKKQGLWHIYERELALIPVVYRMESNGIALKPIPWRKKVTELEKRSDRYERAACRAVRKKKTTLNIRSDKQLRKVIFGTLRCPVLKRSKKTKDPSADETVVSKLIETSKPGSRRCKFLTQLMEYRSTNTLAKYLRNYERTSIQVNRFFWRVHPSYNQTGTATTRFSSSNPNGTNLPDDLRDVFGPRKEHSWFLIDYTQLELRLFAVAAQEDVMIQAFEDGQDIHQITADAFSIPRKIAKNINFAIIYGAGVGKVAEMARMGGGSGGPEAFRRTYPRATAFMRETQEQVKELGYVYTLDGYRLSVEKHMPYAGVDYICQGTAGSLVKSAMVDVDLELRGRGLEGDGVKMVLNVHDELIFEVDNNLGEKYIKKIIGIISEIMQGAGSNMPTPVVTPVDVHRTRTKWSEKKLFKLAA